MCINDGQYVKFHYSSSFFKLTRCKKPDFWAIFIIKSKMAAKKCDLEKKNFYFFYFHMNIGQYVKFHDYSLIPSINETFFWFLAHFECLLSISRVILDCKKKTNLKILSLNSKNKNMHLFQTYIARDACFYFFNLAQIFRNLFFFTVRVFFSRIQFLSHPP